MSTVYVEESLSYDTLKRWKGEFKYGGTSLQDDQIEDIHQGSHKIVVV